MTLMHIDVHAELVVLDAAEARIVKRDTVFLFEDRQWLSTLSQLSGVLELMQKTSQTRSSAVLGIGNVPDMSTFCFFARPSGHCDDDAIWKRLHREKMRSLK